MITRQQHLLIKLAEECVEVAQRCDKAIIFGLNEIQLGQELDNAERIVQELEDLLGVAQMLKEEGIIRPPKEEAIRAKKNRVEKYMQYSIDKGITKL